MFYYQLTRTMMHETIAKFGEREQNQRIHRNGHHTNSLPYEFNVRMYIVRGGGESFLLIRNELAV